MGNLDVNKLPDALVARIAAGENVHAVLASGVSQGLDPQSLLKQPLRLPATSEEDVRDADCDGAGPG